MEEEGHGCVARGKAIGDIMSSEPWTQAATIPASTVSEKGHKGLVINPRGNPLYQAPLPLARLL